MAKLHLVKQQRTEQGYVTLDQILSALSPEELDALDAKVKMMREAFPCPYKVNNYEDFKACLDEYWMHYMKWFCYVDYKAIGMTIDGITKQHAYQFIEQTLGGYQELLTAERNAIAGREGGMIGVIDQITDALGKQITTNYIRSVFFDLIEPGDYDTRLRLAEELLKKYGPYLFPGERLLPHYIIGANLETFIQGFATQLHGIRRQWRR
jgi:hypothetical protein